MNDGLSVPYSYTTFTLREFPPLFSTVNPVLVQGNNEVGHCDRTRLEDKAVRDLLLQH